MSSAERIRERFLHKIGIPPQQCNMQTTGSVIHTQVTGNTVLNSSTSSCLGEVNPTYEPLKVCLDDDSSFEDDDEYDDDFYFGDDQLPTAMDIDTFIRSSQSENLKRLCTLENKVSQNENNNQQTHVNRVEDSSMTDTVNLISDHGSTSSSFDNASMTSSITTPFCFSTGNLTYVSNDSSLDTRSGKRKRGKRKVSLRNEVAVVPIPMREEYPDKVKERVWSSASELYDNAVRNSIEFAAEGWNWRTAIEDENMIVCNKTGELIHPVHLHNLLNFHTSNCKQPGQQQNSNIQITNPPNHEQNT